MAHILIADDRLENIRLMERWLTQQGHRVSAARNGHEALALASADRVDLILLDVQMPDMDGLTVCRRLRAQDSTRPIPVILITAERISQEDLIRGLEAGANDYLTRPVGMGELLARVQAALRTKALHDEVMARNRELAALNSIALAVSQTLELEEVLNRALDEVLDTLNASIGGIYLLDPETNVLRLEVYRGLSPAVAQAADELLLGEGFSGRVAATGQPLYVEDVSSDGRLTRHKVRENGLRSFLGVPLIARDQVVGTLWVSEREYRRFSEREKHLLEAIGRQVGVAVENARLFAQTVQIAEELAQKNEELLEMQERLIEAERLAALGEISIAIRHEINNPLAALTGTAELILMEHQDDLPEQVKADVQTIIRLSHRIRDIVLRLKNVKDRTVPYLDKKMIDLRGEG